MTCPLKGQRLGHWEWFSDLVTQWHSWLFLTNWDTEIITLRVSDKQNREWTGQHSQCCDVFLIGQNFDANERPFSFLLVKTNKTASHCVSTLKLIKEFLSDPVRSLCPLVTDWLLFTKQCLVNFIDICNPGVWRCQPKTCWCCNFCWCGSCWQQFVADLEAEVWSKSHTFVHTLSRRFDQDFEVVQASAQKWGHTSYFQQYMSQPSLFPTLKFMHASPLLQKITLLFGNTKITLVFDLTKVSQSVYPGP